MVKVIFLDIDGVLNAGQNTFVSKKHHHTWSDWPFIGLDRRLVKKFNQLVATTDAKVVLSSTWRLHHTSDEMHARLVSAGMNSEIEVIDRTPIMNTARRTEINAWLRDNAKRLSVTSFVVIDDDGDASIEDHFVQTVHDIGMTDKNVAEAIRILGKKA